MGLRKVYLKPEVIQVGVDQMCQMDLTVTLLESQNLSRPLSTVFFILKANLIFFGALSTHFLKSLFSGLLTAYQPGLSFLNHFYGQILTKKPVKKPENTELKT